MAAALTNLSLQQSGAARELTWINNMRKACKSSQTELRHAADQLSPLEQCRSKVGRSGGCSSARDRRPVIGYGTDRLGFALIAARLGAA
jgi:hypothetical protein